MHIVINTGNSYFGMCVKLMSSVALYVAFAISVEVRSGKPEPETVECSETGSLMTDCIDTHDELKSTIIEELEPYTTVKFSMPVVFSLSTEISGRNHRLSVIDNEVQFPMHGDLSIMSSFSICSLTGVSINSRWFSLLVVYVRCPEKDK